MTESLQVQEFESIDGMSDVCKKALRNILIACADTKLLLGYHYGEWTFGPPAIEAAIACCSLCQTELGHVRLLHGLLNKHYGDQPEAFVDSREPGQFANISYLDHEFKEWPAFVAANYVTDLAVTSVLYTMRNSSFKPLHMSLGKNLQEERYHIHHGQGWFRTLVQKSPAAKVETEKYARIALRKVVEWFGPEVEAGDKELVSAGVKSKLNHDTLNDYLNEVGALADSLDVDLGLSKNGSWALKEPIDWTDWNVKTRRYPGSAPDEQILYHLRGSKNEVFKLN